MSGSESFAIFDVKRKKKLLWQIITSNYSHKCNLLHSDRCTQCVEKEACLWISRQTDINPLHVLCGGEYLNSYLQ